MPKKMPESLREKVVQLRKAGHTYTEIEAMVVNPETGGPLARPTTIKILKEAGLTRGGSPAAAARTTAPSPTGATTPAAPSTSAPTVSPPPLARGNGVDEFMPKPKAGKPAPKAKPDAKPSEAFEFQCQECGAEFTADSEDDVPEACPECGA